MKFIAPRSLRMRGTSLLHPFMIYKVTGPSMEPLFYSKQFVLGSSLPYLFSTPKIGDVILFKRDNTTMIKRIAKIGKGYFVLGDNKQQSTDSRSFGEIAKENIMAKVIWY
jgi:signal peptidase I